MMAMLGVGTGVSMASWSPSAPTPGVSDRVMGSETPFIARSPAGPGLYARGIHLPNPASASSVCSASPAPRSEIQQESQAIFDDVEDGGRDPAERLWSKAIRRDAPDLFAHCEAQFTETTVRRTNFDVGRDASLAGGEWHGNDQSGAALIERAGGDDEDRTLAGLLPTTGGIQVGQPDLTASDTPQRSSNPSSSVPSSSARSASSSFHAVGSAANLA